ncbi:MAG: hypothetical protein QM296_09305 [Bacillota bacterium]|nr:hypothetical protein [Bacillota bacterium]
MSRPEISLVEIELTVQRRGTVRALIDLGNGLVKWRESNRWNRDFTRSLHEHEIRTFLETVAECGVWSWRPWYPDRDRCETPLHWQMSWQLSLYALDPEPVLFIQGRDAWPPEFPLFCDAVSQILRQPFRVQE